MDVEMSKTIPLSQSKFALIDDEDYERVIAYNWYAHRRSASQKFDVMCNVGGRLNHKIIKLHRFITNAPQGMDVDHINGDPLDNRKTNLRVCTRSENLQNSAKHKDNMSGFKGVSKHKNKWVAQIMNNGTKVKIGLFSTPEEAARAYDKKAIELFGEFANINFRE